MMINETAGIWWLEGLFLQPEHFIQESRLHSYCLRDVTQQLSGGLAGFSRLMTDESLTGAGKLTLLQAHGVMPDGTPFITDTPLSVSLDGLAGDMTFLLTLPLSSAPDRFTAKPLSVSENREPQMREPVMTSAAHLNLQLKCASQCREDETGLKVARLHCREGAGHPLPEAEFCAPYLFVQDNPWLSRRAEDIRLLLAQRLQRLYNAPAGETACLHLQPLLTQLQSLAAGDRIFCRDFYRFCLHLQSVLYALTATPAPEPQPWRNDDHAGLFTPCIQSLKHLLAPQTRQHIQPLNWDTRLLTTRRLLRLALPESAFAEQSRLIVEYADDSGRPPDAGRTARLLKLAGNRQIAACVNNGLTGIPLLPLNSVPEGITTHPGAIYFEPDIRSPLWAQMAQDDLVLALHIDGQLPHARLNAILITRR
ncbi:MULTISPECIES: type VI secretion system baseplate subunit TssK [unclassified Morganella (in: enterobacteria)]|uniref:type VI secretion system baseplate subunit TssK n=1 Tax=unclassified Morganella (in: enterobacteria) TaxID=2676694 RepID=UPI002943201D|nr:MULTISPECIES: type VI secretion system baseplate subunit TssK [unclassified Morganella (in: enterobacteria)]